MKEFELNSEETFIIWNRPTDRHQSQKVKLAVQVFPNMEELREELLLPITTETLWLTLPEKEYIFEAAILPGGERVYMTPYLPDDETLKSLLSQRS